VPPGQYYITAGRVDLPTYYPGTLELSKGTTVSIASAGTIANIDFVVQDTSTAAAPAVLGLRGRGGAVAIAPITVLPNLNIQGGRRGGAAALGAVTVAPAGPRAVIIAPDAAWWTNPGLVLRMGVTEEQKKRIEAAAERHRPAIEQSKAVLEKEEATLNRILEAEKLEPVNVTTAQVERVVLARAQVERVNSVLTLEIREILSRSQWLQLQAETRQPAAPLVVVPGGRSGARGGGFGPGGTP
jgi:hypothetical protein